VSVHKNFQMLSGSLFSLSFQSFAHNGYSFFINH